MPGVGEGRDRTNQARDEARQDPDRGAVEGLPQHNRESGARQAELVEDRPPRLAVLEAEERDDRSPDRDCDDLAVDRVLGIHPRQHDDVERLPDDPGRLLGLCLALEDRTDVGKVTDDEHDARKDGKELHGDLRVSEGEGAQAKTASDALDYHKIAALSIGHCDDFPLFSLYCGPLFWFDAF